MSDDSNIRPLPDEKDAVAVALSQPSGRADETPRVIAGGKGSIARQILEIAFQNGIKVREDADLAELLSAVDVDSEIPLEAFGAVAEILTYVYQINNAMADKDEGPETDEQTRLLARDLVDLWRNRTDRE